MIMYDGTNNLPSNIQNMCTFYGVYMLFSDALKLDPTSIEDEIERYHQARMEDEINICP